MFEGEILALVQPKEHALTHYVDYTWPREYRDVLSEDISRKNPKTNESNTGTRDELFWSKTILEAVSVDDRVKNNSKRQQILQQLQKHVNSIPEILNAPGFKIQYVRKNDRGIRENVTCELKRLPVLPTQLLNEIESDPELKNILKDACQLASNLTAIKDDLEQRIQKETVFGSLGPHALVVNPLDLPYQNGTEEIPVSSILFYGNYKLYKRGIHDITPEAHILNLGFHALNLARGEEDDTAKSLFGKTENTRIAAIKLYGIKQPDGTFANMLIGDGRHRIFAAKIAGLQTIQAKVDYIEAADLYIVGAGLLTLFEGRSSQDALVRGLAITPTQLTDTLLTLGNARWKPVVKSGHIMNFTIDTQEVKDLGGMVRTNVEREIEFILIGSREPECQMPVSLANFPNKPNARKALQFYQGIIRKLNRATKII